MKSRRSSFKSQRTVGTTLGLIIGFPKGNARCSASSTRMKLVCTRSHDGATRIATAAPEPRPIRRRVFFLRFAAAAAADSRAPLPGAAAAWS